MAEVHQDSTSYLLETRNLKLSDYDRIEEIMQDAYTMMNDEPWTKKQIKKLNSKAGQMKMDLHDIAEGLPNDLEQLPDAAARTYDIYCQLRDLKQQLKTLEQNQ